MFEENVLENLGFTKSEIKVYTSLLELGLSKKKEIVSKSKIASSKVYEVLDKLKQKGLVTEIIINKIKHFKPANPNSILDHIKNLKEDLNSKEQKIKQELQRFENLVSKSKKETNAEIFFGWKGLNSLYIEILNELNENDENFVIGASSGKDKEKTKRFYSIINKKLRVKRLKLNILFGTNEEKYAKEIQSKGGLKYTKVKFLPFSFSTEMNIFKDNVAIIILTKDPVGILIRNENFAKTSKEYFNSLWKIAK